MTMADSLNTTNLSRRSILSTGIAAAGALAVSALPAIATAAKADAKLLQLCRNWQRIERALNRLIVGPLSDAEEAYSELPIIPKPAILLEAFEVFPSDEGHVCKPELNSLYDMGGARSDRVPYLHRYDLEQVAKGKFYIEAGLLRGHDPCDTSLVPIPQAARDHAKACLAALDQWEAAEQAQHAEVDRWEAKANRLYELQAKVSEQIAALPAHTMEGLNAKLAIVRAEPLYAQDQGIAQSVLADMQRIDTRSPLSPPLAA
jgi:hypothetical protein